MHDIRPGVFAGRIVGRAWKAFHAGVRVAAERDQLAARRQLAQRRAHGALVLDRIVFRRKILQASGGRFCNCD